MTPITVVSTTDFKEATPPAVSAAVETEGQSEETTNTAPVAKATEHNDPATSETAETTNNEDVSEESDDLAAKNVDESEDTEKDRPKKKGGFQRRIDKLNARIADREREAEYWRTEALKKADAGSSETRTDSTHAATDGKPTPDAFETYAEYVEAVTEWKADQKLKEYESRQHRARMEEEHGKLIATHKERVAAFAAKHEDFAELLSDVDDVQVTATVQQLIVQSENGPALMYELAKNRGEFERINTLSPIAAAREIGKIEARLASASVEAKRTETKKTTKAPEPIAPVGSKGSAREKSIYDADLTQREYEALRAKQRSA